MEKPSSDELNKLLSLTDDALRLTEELYGGIKDYKKLVMRQFLGKGYGETESRWPLTLLSELTGESGIREGPDDSATYQEYYRDEGLPLLESKLLTELRLAEGVVFLKDDVRDAFQQFVVRGGDILMVREGDYAGASVIVPIFHGGGMLGPRCVRIRLDTDRCEAFYLLNVLHFYYREGVFEKLRRGDGMSIEVGTLSELQIPLPPLEDQKQITGTLLELSGAMVAQEAYRHAIERLREMIEKG